MLWATSLMFTKASILLFYMRIFDVDNYFRTVAQLATGAIVLWCLSVVLSSILLCWPFAYNWDQSIPGHCGNQVLSYIITGAFNIVTDLIVLCMPMPIIWKLQMPRANKVALTIIFAIGFLWVSQINLVLCPADQSLRSICIVSIVRIVAISKISYTDISYSLPLAFIWSMLEPTLGITIACIPVMRPLFMRGINSSRDKGSGYQSASGSNFDSRNFQNIDRQQLYPLQDVRHETVIGRMSEDNDSLRTASNQSNDVIGLHTITQDVGPIGGINVTTSGKGKKKRSRQAHSWGFYSHNLSSHLHQLLGADSLYTALHRPKLEIRKSWILLLHLILQQIILIFKSI